MAAFIRCAVSAGVICACGLPAVVPAQDKLPEYPRKPIRILIGIAPGGGLDTMTRVAAQVFTERWGQSVVVDNRPGGGTVIATEMAAQAVPDGYTLLCASDTLKLNGIFKRMSFDVRTAFVPVVRLTAQPYVIVVHPSLPVKTVKELIALGKSKPGVLTYGTPGFGTTLHIGWERLAKLTGVDFVHVAYRGGAPAMLDLMAGQIHMVMSTTVTTAPHIRSGKVRAIAATGPARSKVFPELPTLSEAGVPGLEVKNAYALFAPAGIPAAIVQAINTVIAQGMNTPDILKKVVADGSEVAAPQTPEQFKVEFAREYAELEESIKASGIQLK